MAISALLVHYWKLRCLFIVFFSHLHHPVFTNFANIFSDYKDLLTDKSNTSQNLSTHFDLIANISHEGKPEKGNGIYKVHVQNRGKEQWYQIQDLIVEEIMHR